jgi:hypothetical protein
MAERDEERLEALKGLTILALHDGQFRRGAIDDLEGTLRRYGFDLTDREMERLRVAQREGAEMSDDDLVEELRARRSRVRILSEEEERVLPTEEYIALAWR